MEYRVLGSLEVVGVEGPLELRGAKERAVLACLPANIGRTVSPDEIVDAVWGEHPPASAVRSLHAHISKPALSLGGRESEAAGLARGRSEHALAPSRPVARRNAARGPEFVHPIVSGGRNTSVTTP